MIAKKYKGLALSNVSEKTADYCLYQVSKGLSISESLSKSLSLPLHPPPTRPIVCYDVGNTVIVYGE